MNAYSFELQEWYQQNRPNKSKRDTVHLIHWPKIFQKVQTILKFPERRFQDFSSSEGGQAASPTSVAHVTSISTTPSY